MIRRLLAASGFLEGDPTQRAVFTERHGPLHERNRDDDPGGTGGEESQSCLHPQ
jgi:hypothetical protein